MTVTVNQPVTPTFTQVAAICNGGAFTLPTTSNNGYTGTWSPAINNTATTPYTFTPTAGQCATTTTMTVTVNQPVTPTFTQVAAICNGGAFTLPTTSNNSITGTWSPANNNTATTTYTFTPTAGQCATTSTMTVTVNQPVASTFSQVAAICSGDALSLPTTSNNGYTGSWSPAINNTATTTYTFTPAAGQCATTATMTVTVNQPVTPTFTQVAAICSGDALSLSTTSNNGYTGTWSPAINNTATTTYTFTPTAGQCATTTTMTVTVNQPVTPTFTQVAAICNGGAFTLPTTSNNGYTGTWSPAINNTATTTYTFTPIVGQCATTATMTVIVNPIPVVFAGNDIVTCSGQNVTLSGSGATTYVWSNGVTNGVAFTPNAGTTTYSVTGTTAEGCSDTDDINVTVNTTAQVSFVPDVTEGCAPLTVNFVNSTPNGIDCSWSFGDGTFLNDCGNVANTFESAGCYDITLTVTDANGCSGSLSLPNLICVDEVPTASFSASNTQISEFDNIVLFDNNSLNATQYDWDFGDNSANSQEVNPTHEFEALEDGSYVVTLVASSDLGCSDTAVTVIQVLQELIYYVPNSFTPDNDIFNQTFKPVFTSGFDPYDYTLRIYDRWGELIFESHNASIGWDGTYGQGDYVSVVQDGAYVWQIEFKTLKTDERKIITGHVNLIR
jgi:gliding motility-associated-like protein